MWLTIGPSGSAAVDESVAASPTNGSAGEIRIPAVGGAFTATVPLTIAKPPPTSVTLRAMDFEPAPQA